MTSTYDSENIKISDFLARPSTTQGSILASDGTTFQQVSPSLDGQILISDSTQTSGVKWTSPSDSLAFSSAVGQISIPTIGSSVYYISSASTSTIVPRCFPNSTCIYITINTNNTGYSAIPTNITGGTFDFTLGYIPANTAATVGNFIAYSGSPHLQINGTDINTAAKNYNQFSSMLDISITEGQQVVMIMTNNLTSPGGNTFINFNSLILFRATGYTV